MSFHTVEQIRRVLGDNLRIIFCSYFSIKTYVVEAILMRTHNMFLWRNKQNYPWIITKYLLVCSIVTLRELAVGCHRNLLQKAFSDFRWPSTMSSLILEVSDSQFFLVFPAQKSCSWVVAHGSIQCQMSCLMTKPTKCHVRPAKTQISLGFCPVWSESSLSAWRKLGSLATH